jgi:FkbM family methyltransferase
MRWTLRRAKAIAKGALRRSGFEVARLSRRERASPNPSGYAAVNTIQADIGDRLDWPKRPIAFVLVSSNHGLLIINRNDYQMLNETNGFGFGYQVLNSSCYDYAEIKLLLALLSNRRKFHGSGVVAIDCGANCGVHTVEWSRHMYGWGSVIAIEAQEKIYYALCGNITLNNCLNAKAILAAVGRDNREIFVPCPDYFKPASFGSLEIRKSNSNEFIGQPINYLEENCARISQIAIDELKLDRLDLLKIDVEGMEADVLAGAAATIRKHLPQMYIELLKADAEEIKSTLNTLGYKFFIFGANLIAIHERDNAGGEITMKDGILRVGRSVIQ